MKYNNFHPRLKRIIEQIEKIQVTNHDLDKIDELGLKALELIETILDETPLDIQTRMMRIRLNDNWIFSNQNQVIVDANFILQFERDNQARMFAYDRLVSIYKNRADAPEELIAILEDQLLDIQNAYPHRYQKNKAESESLYLLGEAYEAMGQAELALSIYQKSYNKYPYLQGRNAVVGIKMLDAQDYEGAEKMLWNHYLWQFDAEDEEDILKYAAALLQHYKNNNLTSHPNLIALLLHIARIKQKEFVMDAEDANYFEYCLAHALTEYPNNSRILVVKANHLLMDLDQADLALEYYKQALLGDNPNFQDYIQHIKTCCIYTQTDFFDLPFNFAYKPQNINVHFTIAEELYSMWQATNDIEYIELGIKYIQSSYKHFKKYIFHEKGSTYCNQTHIFELSCKIFGQLLVVKSDDQDAQTAKFTLRNASILFWEGYQVNQYFENLNLAIHTAFDAKEYMLCIEYAQQFTADMGYICSDVELQRNHWFIGYSHCMLKDVKSARKNFEQAKSAYIKNKNASDDSLKILAETGFIYFTLSMETGCNPPFAVLEMDWMDQNVLIAQSMPHVYGGIQHYIGVCYEKMDNMKQAMQYYNNAKVYLEESDLPLYKQLFSLTQEKLQGN